MRQTLFKTLLGIMICSLVLSFVPAGRVQAAGPWFVRAGGSDTTCTGLANADAAAAPACAFATLQKAIASATAGDTINVAAGTYSEAGQIVINKNLTITGADRTTTILKPTASTGPSGDAGGWILVSAGTVLTMSNFTLDGTGFDIVEGVRSLGSGVLSNLLIQNITAAGDLGDAIALSGNTNVLGSRFTNIGRIGIHASGAGVTTANFQNNIIAGSTAGAAVDYGIAVEDGAVVSVSQNVITGYTGTVGPNASSAILVNGASTVSIDSNSLTGNQIGIQGLTAATITAHFNHLYSNITGILTDNPAVTVNAENNWWGCNAGPTNLACDQVDSSAGGTVDFDPWLVLTAGPDPAAIAPSGTASITANLNQNSDNATPGGTLPVDISAAFVLTAPNSGSVSPTTGLATAGVFTTTYTAPASTGSYQVCTSVDSQAACNTVAVQAGPNTPPVAVADTYQAIQGRLLTVNAAAGVLANDTDAESSPLTAVLNVTTTNGVLTLAADGSFTYQPNPGFTGADTFTYHASDGTDSSNIVTVTINVGENFPVYLPIIAKE